MLDLVHLAVAGLAWPGWLAGLFFGVLLSAPSAIVTKAWAPILSPIISWSVPRRVPLWRAIAEPLIAPS